MTTEVDAKIISILRERFPHLNEFDESSLAMTLNGLKLDSLELIEIVYELEEYFSITIHSSALEKLGTIVDLVNVVDSELKQVA
jgi:acyl carrier protein